MSRNTLVYMANQIERFFRSTGHDKAAAGIADHVAKFWEPRMRRQIYAYLDEGGKGLEPLAKEALEMLRKTDPVAKEGSDGNVVDEPRHAESSGH